MWGFKAYTMFTEIGKNLKCNPSSNVGVEGFILLNSLHNVTK